MTTVKHMAHVIQFTFIENKEGELNEVLNELKDLENKYEIQSPRIIKQIMVRA